MAMAEAPDIYGLLAEFGDAESLRSAAAAATAAGYRRVDAFTPMPVEGLAEALGKTYTRIPAITFLGGLVGGISGYALQYYVAVIAYPLNVGGRPLHSWPAFIPVTFEMTVLCAALAAVLGMLALNGLPRPHHPLFNIDEFKLASRDMKRWRPAGCLPTACRRVRCPRERCRAGIWPMIRR
jgi:ActD protein